MPPVTVTFALTWTFPVSVLSVAGSEIQILTLYVLAPGELAEHVKVATFAWVEVPPAEGLASEEVEEPEEPVQGASMGWIRALPVFPRSGRFQEVRKVFNRL